MIVKDDFSVMEYDELERIKQFMDEKDETLKKGDIKRSLSFRFAKYLLISGLGNLIDIMDSLLSIVLCGLWAYDTYNDGMQPYIEYIIEVIITFLLVFFFLINIFVSDDKIIFALSIYAALDYITLLPTILLDIGVVTGTVFAFWRVVRIICCLRLEKVLARKNSLIGKAAYRLIITLFSLILISGAAILEIDNYYIREQMAKGQRFSQKSDLSLLSFHDMFYFMIVTISTVGYGDISPRHDISKVIVVFTLLLMLAFIPAQTQDLMKVISLTSSYSRVHYQSQGTEVHHILLMGDVSFNTIKMFLDEFYHQDHGATEIFMIIMQSTPPTEDFVNLLAQPQYESRVMYLQGNWHNFADLKRCLADRIDCGIILSKMSTSSPMLEDYKNILRAFSIKKYGAVKGGKNIRIALQLLKPQNKAIFDLGRGLNNFDQVICAEELKLQLIAKSCVCPGIITLISTLITSGVPPLAGEDSVHWQNQWPLSYLLGMQHEVYRIRLDGARFGGYRYSDVCRAMYAEFSIIVVAIEVPIGADERRVFVHPSNYVLSTDSHYIYVINMALPDIEKINAINMAEARFQKYEPSRLSPKDLSELKKKQRIQVDKEDYRKNYYMLKRPAQQEEAALYKADYRKIENHVIICGLVSSIEYFILALRTKIMGGSRPPIIIMTTEQIKTEIWKKINLFEDVYFIRGSPLNPADLERASINRAIGVVILSEEMSDGKKLGNKNTKEAEAIFIYKTIKNMNTRAFVVIELSTMAKVSFLLGSKNTYTTKYGNIMSEPFAAGEVYIPSLLDALMCQAFYLPYIMQIIQQFIMGDALTPKDVIDIYKRMDLAQSALFLMDMSPDLVNQKYFSCVFDKCVAEKGMLPIGLYKADPSNPKPYVFLSPPDDTPISSNDKLFVLSEYNPSSLQEGNMLLGRPTLEAKMENDENSIIISKLKGEAGRVDTENAKQLHAIEKRMAELLDKAKKISVEAEEPQDAWEGLIGDHVRLFVRNKTNVQYP